jgi:hypothetical protein
MKKAFGSKIDKAMAKAYTDLYKVMDGIKFSAKEVASGDCDTMQSFEDTMSDIVSGYQQYLLLKKYIDLLESEEEGG